MIKKIFMIMMLIGIFATSSYSFSIIVTEPIVNATYDNVPHIPIIAETDVPPVSCYYTLYSLPSWTQVYGKNTGQYINDTFSDFANNSTYYFDASCVGTGTENSTTKSFYFYTGVKYEPSLNIYPSNANFTLIQDGSNLIINLSENIVIDNELTNDIAGHLNLECSYDNSTNVIADNLSIYSSSNAVGVINNITIVHTLSCSGIYSGSVVFYDNNASTIETLVLSNYEYSLPSPPSSQEESFNEVVEVVDGGFNVIDAFAVGIINLSIAIIPITFMGLFIALIVGIIAIFPKYFKEIFKKK
jgi:hypothetical protein